MPEKRENTFCKQVKSTLLLFLNPVKVPGSLTYTALYFSEQKFSDSNWIRHPDRLIVEAKKNDVQFPDIHF